MAIGALFAPKLAGKFHNLHYQSKQNENFAIFWSQCVMNTVH